MRARVVIVVDDVEERADRAREPCLLGHAGEAGAARGGELALVGVQHGRGGGHRGLSWDPGSRAIVCSVAVVLQRL